MEIIKDFWKLVKKLIKYGDKCGDDLMIFIVNLL